jgi:hypothetical protein
LSKRSFGPVAFIKKSYLTSRWRPPRSCRSA